MFSLIIQGSKRDYCAFQGGLNSYEITNIKVYKMDENGEAYGDPINGAEDLNLVYGSKYFSINGTLPYIQIAQVDYDVIITCDFKMLENVLPHSIYFYEDTTSNATKMYNYFSGYQYIIGTSNKAASAKYFAFDNRSYKYPSNNLHKVGYILPNTKLKYTLFSTNDTSKETSIWAQIKSWHIYRADENGNPVGKPIEEEIGLSLPNEPDTAYVESFDRNYYFNNLTFEMPYYDIVFIIKYDETFSPIRVEQYTVDGSDNRTVAGNKFSIEFTGENSYSESGIYSLGKTLTAVSTEENKCTDFAVADETKMKLTFKIPNEYIVSGIYIWYNTPKRLEGDYLNLPENAGEYYNGAQVINGYVYNYVTQADYNAENLTLTMENPSNRNIYRLIICYSKPAHITITQSTSGTVLDGNISSFGHVTLSKNSTSPTTSTNTVACPFFNVSDDNTATSQRNGEYPSVSYSLTEQSKKSTSSVYCGTQLRISVVVDDSTRVLSHFRVYRVKDGKEEDLKYTSISYSYQTTVYTLDEPVDNEDDIRIDVEYAVADKLTVDVKVKSPGKNKQLLSNDIGVTATITGSGALTEEGAFKKLNGTEYIDSFVVGSDAAMYTTVGNTNLTIKIENVPDGYVIANVDATTMTSEGGIGKSLSGVTTKKGKDTDLGESRDYSECYFTMPGNNIYIRITIAKTTEVTVNFQSRGEKDNDVFR